MSTNKLYVGNLSSSTDESGLRHAFTEFGDITEVSLVNDPETGDSRGFAFVTFDHEEDATYALEDMDGAQIDGAQIKVNEAWERHQKPSFNGHGGPNGKEMTEIREALFDAQRAVKRAMLLVTKYGGDTKPHRSHNRGNGVRRNHPDNY
jgi:RNA recognition motif-containing protein